MDLDNNGFIPYYFHTVLELFPGLQLSTLTVQDTYHHPDSFCDGWGHDQAYEDVQNLIGSDGYKELIYVSNSDRFLKADHRQRTSSLDP